MIEGGGIEVSSRSDTAPLFGDTTISRNTLLSTRSFSAVRQYGIGALWFYAPDDPFVGTITAESNWISDSPWKFLGVWVGKVNIGKTTVRDVGPFFTQNQAALGSVTISHLTGELDRLGVGGPEGGDHPGLRRHRLRDQVLR